MTHDSGAEGKAGHLGRRGFVKVCAAGAAGWLLSRCSPEERTLGFRPAPRERTSFITPNGDFYLVAVDPSYRPPLNPANVAARWVLAMKGIAGATGRMAYPELLSAAKRTVLFTFECIGNPVGGELIGNARWQVVPLKSILMMAPGGLMGVRSMMFEGLDGFFSSVSVERATDDYAFLAVQMNGAPLPAAHGFPARVMLPDLYGMKQPRWLKRISLLRDADTTSYWEARGWGGEIPIKIMSRFDPHAGVRSGRPAELTGVAFAGRRGIARVELSLDDGGTWVPCELVTGKKSGVWSLWRYVWRKPVAGRYTFRVRAIDGRGAIQDAHRHNAYPDGATGYDQLEVGVSG